MRTVTELLSKLLFYRAFRTFGFPKLLPLNYTFSLTFRCNSRCQTCNIWRKKSSQELTANQWRKIFCSLGRSPFWVTLSGGEPFLRKDLVRIVKDLCQICQPKIITIPTNGILTEKIQKDVQAILKNCRQTRLIVNLSLDGVDKQHDRIRGVKGNFEKVMTTFKSLRKIKAQNFLSGVHTVISKENVSQFPRLCNFVFEKLKPDSYVTEIAEQRKELGTIGKNITPSLQDYQEAITYLEKKIKGQKWPFFSKLTQKFRLTYYDLVGKTLKQKKQAIPCYAGIASAQIAPNGDVWPCCVRADVLGNLKKENFDFGKIWFSKKADRARESIKNKECCCPLANVFYTNVLMHPPTLIKVIKKLF